MRKSVVSGLIAAVLLAALGAGAAAVAGEQAAAAPVTAPVELAGRWVGSKLRCQKEGGKLVRCGTPAPFEISFFAGGSGTTPEEALPLSFAWRWISPTELGVRPAAGGDELKLFGLEHDDGALTFQAYVFLPTADPNQPAESRYLHFVFDVNRAE